MDLFHLAQQRLGRGSVILPGNYGRLLARLGWPHAASHREAILEAVRAEHYAQLPSRLRCVFCFARRGDAAVFQAEDDGFKHHVLHRVRPSDDGAATHETDRRWFNPDATGSDFPTITWAALYWHGLPLARAPPGRPGPPPTPARQSVLKWQLGTPRDARCWSAAQ